MRVFGPDKAIIACRTASATARTRTYSKSPPACDWYTGDQHAGCSKLSQARSHPGVIDSRMGPVRATPRAGLQQLTLPESESCGVRINKCEIGCDFIQWSIQVIEVREADTVKPPRGTRAEPHEGAEKLDTMARRNAM